MTVSLPRGALAAHLLLGSRHHWVPRECNSSEHTLRWPASSAACRAARMRSPRSSSATCASTAMPCGRWHGRGETQLHRLHTSAAGSTAVLRIVTVTSAVRM